MKVKVSPRIPIEPELLIRMRDAAAEAMNVCGQFPERFLYIRMCVICAEGDISYFGMNIMVSQDITILYNYYVVRWQDSHIIV